MVSGSSKLFSSTGVPFAPNPNSLAQKNSLLELHFLRWKSFLFSALFVQGNKE